MQIRRPDPPIGYVIVYDPAIIFIIFITLITLITIVEII